MLNFRLPQVSNLAYYVPVAFHGYFHRTGKYMNKCHVFPASADM